MDSVEERRAKVAKRREELGTKPRELEEKLTVYHRGGAAVRVSLISEQENPYRAMYSMATQTWGGPWDSGVEKWDNASVVDRHLVVQAILQRQALPLALEHPQFLFEITGCSRSAFDQIARARLGVTFSSMGTRDNAHGDFEVVVPPPIYDDPHLFECYKSSIEESKRMYCALLRAGRSWQDARAVLPQSMVHRFNMNINYAALSTLLGKRLQFCEQPDTVAVAWKLLEALDKSFAVLALPLRPSCDFARKCTYHQENLGEHFTSLFNGCGRWPEPYPAGDFDESSTDQKDISVILTDERLLELVDNGEMSIEWAQAFERDARFFEG
jgi:hypothetical protein